MAHKEKNTWLQEVLSMEEQTWVQETLERFDKKMKWVSEKSKDKIPAMAKNGVHDDRSDLSVNWNPDDGLFWWTNGFWSGMLWMMYVKTGNRRYADIAGNSEKKLDKCFEGFYGLHHDVGFMWVPTAVASWKLTKNKESRRRALHAANLLMGRFNPAGNYIRAWNDIPGSNDDTRGWAIIDSLFNITLLYWAYEETRDPRFWHVAIKHADKLQENFIRPDGSVRHIVEFDPMNGDFICDYGGQGYAQGSSWTRGQSWALYGFILSYIHTGNAAYLDTSKRVAHYFIANISENGLIPVDFRQPKEPVYYDDTAAAIAACGLIEIAKYVPEMEKEMYIRPAMKMLRSLDEVHCEWSEKNDCFLTHCSSSYHSPMHNHTLVYADSFFLEALLKLSGEEFLLW